MIKATVAVLSLILFAPIAQAQSLTFAWDLSVNDAQLGTGGGYHVYWSRQSGSYAAGMYICSANPGITTCTGKIPGGLGKYYFVATAFTADGTESVYSNELLQVIKPEPPHLNTVTQVARGIVKKIGSSFAAMLGSKKTLRIIDSE